MLSRDTVKIEAQESDGLLSEARRVVRSESRVTTQHTEIIGERGSSSRSIAEQVIDHCSTAEAGEASIVPLEVQVREPVVGLVLRDWNRCTFTLAQEGRVGVHPEVATTKH